MNITIEAANSSEGATTGGSNGATGATGATGGGTTGGSITSSFLPTTLSQPPEMVPRKEITTDELEIVGYVLWAIIVLTLIGNFCSFYPVLHRSNFKVFIFVLTTFYPVLHRSNFKVFIFVLTTFSVLSRTSPLKLQGFYICTYYF